MLLVPNYIHSLKYLPRNDGRCALPLPRAIRLLIGRFTSWSVGGVLPVPVRPAASLPRGDGHCRRRTRMLMLNGAQVFRRARGPDARVDALCHPAPPVSGLPLGTVQTKPQLPSQAACCSPPLVLWQRSQSPLLAVGAVLSGMCTRIYDAVIGTHHLPAGATTTRRRKAQRRSARSGTSVCRPRMPLYACCSAYLLSPMSPDRQPASPVFIPLH